MKRLVILFSNFGPYHLARLEGLYNFLQLNNSCIEVIGIEIARFETEYAWRSNITGFPFSIYSVIPDRKVEQVSLIELVQNLYLLLSKINPNVLAIAGYSNPAMLSALVWSRWQRKCAILLSETTEADFPRSFWKEKIKSLLVQQYQSALVGGQPQKRYLIKLGMPKEAITFGYNIVGNKTFHPDRICNLPIPMEKPFFLAINRFITKKNLPFLINAYADYRQKSFDTPWHLVLCGDGELRLQLEQMTVKLGVQDCVHFTGFLQQDQLLPYFAHAKCFVHASTHEQWGLVVNEAMAAGLPVLVSDRCGCYEDLIIEGVNGFGFDPQNSQQLTDLMLKMSSADIDLSTMGNASLKHIQRFSPDYFAQGLIEAIDYALDSP